MKKIVFFDLDSTLVSIEGLDELAKKKGVGNKAKHLTNLAMNGDVAMEAVFGKKVALIAPSKQELEELGHLYIHSLVAGAKEVITHLKQDGFEVGIVTGNFLPAALHISRELGIPKKLVFANTLLFNKNGSFKNFDTNGLLAKSGGKAEIMKQFKKYQIIFVGDSVTDLDTKPFVHLFIGFGGVVKRQKVQELAEVFIESFSELIPVVKKHLYTKDSF